MGQWTNKLVQFYQIGSFLKFLKKKKNSDLKFFFNKHSVYLSLFESKYKI